MIGTSVYFSTYEVCKQIIPAKSPNQGYTSPLGVALAGGICGAVSWTLIYPIDSAKSIYQRNCLSTGKALRLPRIKPLNREMYRGLGVSMGRSCVVNALFFSVFEYVKKQLDDLED